MGTTTDFNFSRQFFLAVLFCGVGWYLLSAADWTVQNVRVSLVGEAPLTQEEPRPTTLLTAEATVPNASDPIGDEAACIAYIERYAALAKDEEEKFNIPASITLAQGLLESAAGTSRLAATANNHFGIKCISKKCSKGHCVNATDDTHKDFFRKYPSVWASFRDHSHFLSNAPRYQDCFRQEGYRAWAIALQKAGYATDTKYAKSLIARIEKFGLHKYDR